MAGTATPTREQPEAASKRPLHERLRGPRRPRRALVAVVAVLLLLAAAGTGWRLRETPERLTRADVDAAVTDGVEAAEQRQREQPADASVAYQTILPSLVTITTRRSGADAAGAQTGLGAGVVINADGAVMTALHVVDDVGPTITDEAGGGVSSPIQVTFADGTTAQARLAQRDPAQDIAVLAVDALPDIVVPAVLGGGVQVGDEVYPVGSPFGLSGSLSAGVVSALDRSVRVSGGDTLNGLIQFDAAVNPGNSGGPLLNRGGQVVGIVTGLANPAEQKFFVGVGFAVPISSAGGVAGGPQK